MRPNQIDEQRLNVLEDILEIQYEKLGEFQRELPINASTNQKFELKQRIKREILPDIRKYEVEYGQILAAGIQEAFVVSDVDAEKAIVKVEQAVEHIENIQTESYPQELTRLLQDLREMLNEPGKTAQAKLKVALPVIPLIASYELEMDTEAFLVNAWRGIKSLVRGRA